MARSSDEEILHAAGRLIGAHGFDAVSVADIAEACGMSKQALLYHYRNKDAIKTAVINFLIEHSNRTLLEMLGSITDDADARLDHTLQALHQAFKSVPWAAAVVLRFFLDNDEAVIERINQGTLAWARYTSEEIKRGARDGRFRQTPDPESTLEQVGMLVLTNFALLQHKSWSGGSSKKTASRKLAELARVLRLILFQNGQAGAQR